jgi:alpha-L-fucosidase
MGLMNQSRRRFLMGAAAGAAAWQVRAADAGTLRPYGALPSARQLQWHEMETYAFLHFTVNTFTDREWGLGDEAESVFNPTAFDADAIVGALKAGGMKGVILTAKHHDGFCLWPTHTTEHCVRNSSWLGGRGDVVKAISEAARKQGLKFGVYLSPWDRNNAEYGRPAYVETYRAQLRELLTGYGPIFEVWHDGANGGDGFYGGAKEKRLIDKRTYYDWPRTWELIRSLQPQAVIFSDAGPDIRWVGNENGIAGETCWATYRPVAADGGPGMPGDVREKELNVGTKHSGPWLPAECDVSIRPGWFWHEKENAQVKTPRQLMDLYYQSVGRGASFLLNIPPDRRGLLHEADVASLAGFGKLRQATFATNLAAHATVKASNVRGNSDSYAARNLLNGRRDTCWATDDTVTRAEVSFELPRPANFNLVRLREDIRLGQRVEAFAVDVWKDGQWSPFGEGTSIGSCRILCSNNPVSAARVRLRITQSPVAAAIAEFGLFAESAGA